MQELSVYAAINQAIAEEMRHDERVMMFGEGVATKRQDLLTEFGAQRIRNTPLAEGIIAGTAVGAAATGLRPVVDLLFAPFLCYAMDEIVNSAGKLRFISGGQFEFPLVVLTMTGAGWGVGAQHNHNLESWFVHCPGLKVVMPSNAADFKGLMKAAIRDNNPVLFFVDIALMYQTGQVADGEVIVPLGQAATCRAGEDLTIISYAKTVGTALQAAEQLAQQHISAEVIDLRSLKPLDQTAILQSARKTGRVMIVHEAGPMCGMGAEIAALIAEHAFAALKAPVLRLTGPDAPVAASYPLEQAFVPQVDALLAAAQRLMAH